MNTLKNPERLKKWKNWWYYYKWYVVCGILVLGITCQLIGNALGLWSKKPDFQIAYVGKMILSEETMSILEQTFASIGNDFNGDGEVIVQVNKYVSGIPNADAETTYYEYADEVSLIGDISDCESYFFLTDNPDNLQREFQILANPDGSCPDEMDYSTEGKVIAWADCPLLYDALYDAAPDSYGATEQEQEQTAQEPEQDGNDREMLLGLYLGRRCFYTDKQTDNLEQCNALWDLISSSAD